MWKEAIVSKFELDPLLRSSGKTEESLVKIYHDGVSPGLELNLCPPEYEVLPALWRICYSRNYTDTVRRMWR